MIHQISHHKSAINPILFPSFAVWIQIIIYYSFPMVNSGNIDATPRFRRGLCARTSAPGLTPLLSNGWARSEIEDLWNMITIAGYHEYLSISRFHKMVVPLIIPSRQFYNWNLWFLGFPIVRNLYMYIYIYIYIFTCQSIWFCKLNTTNNIFECESFVNVGWSGRIVLEWEWMRKK